MQEFTKEEKKNAKKEHKRFLSNNPGQYEKGKQKLLLRIMSNLQEVTPKWGDLKIKIK